MVAAQDHPSASAQQALAGFCQAYWPPLYAFLRRRGHPSSDAQDITQGFFVSLLEHNTLSRARRENGRLRTFLLRSLQYFLTNEYDRAQTLKRGGGRQIISMDEYLAEAEEVVAATTRFDASACYDQEWVATIVDRAWKRLQAESAQAGKARTLEALKPFLVGGPTAPPSQEQVAARLNLPAVTLRKALLATRRRYREIIRMEVAETVADPAEIDDELRYLYQLLLA